MQILLRAIALATALGWIATAGAAEENWPKSLTVATASPGGVYYVYGDAVAQLLTKKLNIPVNTLPTQGPVHNVRLVHSGDVGLGLITMGVGLQAWRGDAEWTKQQQLRNIRALFPMYDTTFQFVVLQKSKIRTLADMQGARVGVGPRAGTGGTYVPAMLKALNVHAEIGNGSFADIAIELVGGRFDAVILAGGAPFPAFRETESNEPLQFISLLPAEIQAVRAAMPELSLSRIPAGTYGSLRADYDTVGVYNFAIANTNLPRTLAYMIVKAIHENHNELVKRHSAAKETLAVNVEKNTFLPFHPGAIDYYREIGINVPKELVPSG